MKFSKKSTIIFAIIFIYAGSIFADDMSFGSFVGKWRDEGKDASGVAFVVDYEISADHKFKGVGSENGVQKFTYDGEVNLIGNELVWKYIHWNMKDANEITDIDVIVTVLPNEYTFHSKTSGETRTSHRIK